MKTLPLNVDFAGQRFPFELCRRPLLFGSAGSGTYYWVDGRQFRRGNTGPNFRPCIDIWWQAAVEEREAHLPENLVQRVLAECYPLVNTSKAVQDIYIDAHLRRTADREYNYGLEGGLAASRSERTYRLPDDESARLRDIARSRDSDRVRSELEGLFLGELPSADELPAFREAARAWIGNGIAAFESDGQRGLDRYTTTIDEWIRRIRRGSGEVRPRLFVNMFAYECKVAFYSCYTSAWVGILNQLRATDQLDPLGERFMQVWHYQNQAADDGQIQRDVFCGQVLALHPLSAVVLTAPEHLAVIGNWIGHPDYESLHASRQVGESDEYWDLVATILIAAHEYAHSRRRQDESRKGPRPTTSVAVADVARNDAPPPVSIYFEDFAAERGWVCESCGSALVYMEHQLSAGDEPGVTVTYGCTACREPRVIQIAADGFEE